MAAEGSSCSISKDFVQSLSINVLLIDGNIKDLNHASNYLLEFGYNVTTCFEATTALSLLRKKKRDFDIVLTDVHMPVMDGFQLLELVGLEMDVPVIMVSIDGTTDAMIKGYKKGACDYLVKPLKKEELKNIWKHVVIKRGQVKRKRSKTLEESDTGYNYSANVPSYNSSVNDASDGFQCRNKRRCYCEYDFFEQYNGKKKPSKKARVSWSKELHEKFVNVVNALGIDKAAPKKIHDLMDDSTITKENVSSHLQKYKLYLKRFEEAQNNGLIKPNEMVGKLGQDFTALADLKQTPGEIATLDAANSGHPASRFTFPAVDRPVLQQAPVQEHSCLPVGPPLSAAISGHPADIFTFPAMDRPVPQQAPVQEPVSFIVEPGITFDQYPMYSETNISNGSITSQMTQQQQSASLLQQLASQHTTYSQTNASNGIIPTQMAHQLQVASLPSENHRENRVDHSALPFPCQSSNNFQVGSHQFVMNQLSHSPPNFQPVNSHVPHDHISNYISQSPTVNWAQFSSPQNDIILGLETQGNINLDPLLNDGSFSFSTSSSVPTSTESNGTWPVLPSDVNVNPPTVGLLSPN